mmetsp:Transcript_8745/g.10001  ORF Transcript_8745/g.10001 Transcript_8745/m.10001 type:complete len:375 (+) Transcript_8745:124-1248(+)|eukprot:CAMPEP_0184024192 /NCGR_PEP_ID=MMETSP0954-20121128/11907_1 /TAXON_ID=627963 /ORGANISM="Aplanochytrium sp, Strain PBS07" /LENGTH=374 /DNA_ID=CAMNT_0026307415 /DNA_START=131 /DNA_END=1255 /DNA_ORIENTATION=+
MANLDEEYFPPTVQNILDQDSLKWIFVGGKGGVGKTTTSCCLGVLLSAVRESVLIVSTDPAHNLSDAFCQKFTHEPTLVNGFDNLYCMEVESAKMAQDMQPSEAAQAAMGIGGEGLGGLQSMMKDLSGTLPGIDEAMSFTEIMKSVQRMKYSCIVFDTAPTGHTLRLLRFPTTLQTAINKMMDLKSRFGGLFNQVSGMLGGNAGMQEEMLNKFEETRQTIEQVNTLFSDPDKTTFVCVAIPEFLSVFETERLVQELTKYNIDTHNIVVNQVLHNEGDMCRKMQARKKMQDKYLNQISELYEDFNVTIMPLQDFEVRGGDSLKGFSQYLINPYKPAKVEPSAKPSEVVKFIAEKHDLNEDEIRKELDDAGLRVPK